MCLNSFGFKISELKTIMERFIDYGVLQYPMSGSGPTIFGVFENLKGSCKEKF